jgi:hypothetical protein
MTSGGGIYNNFIVSSAQRSGGLDETSKESHDVTVGDAAKQYSQGSSNQELALMGLQLRLAWPLKVSPVN